MSGPAMAAPPRSHAYSIFILVLTIMSLAIMVLLLLPLDDKTIQVLTVYDNIACVIFLIDFAINFRRAPSKRYFFINQRGWLDLLGSIPTFGAFKFTALLRLARLSRLSRILRMLRGQEGKALVLDVLSNRGQYAALITVLSAFVVLTASSVLVLQFESKSPDANITTGGDALWWAIVTITTVGYGDTFPVTELGRATGVAVMVAGVGIIGALASILASILVPQPDKPDPLAVVESTTSVLEAELAGIKAELVALRQSLASEPPHSSG